MGEAPQQRTFQEAETTCTKPLGKADSAQELRECGGNAKVQLESIQEEAAEQMEARS